MFAALSRSRRLVRGRFWRIFGILVLAELLAGLVGGILTGLPMVGAMAAAVASPGSGTAVVALAAMAVCTVLSSAVVTPFCAGVVGLLYIDQRMRREGLDLTLARAARENERQGSE